MLRPILDFFWETPGAAVVPCSSATGVLQDEFIAGDDISAYNLVNTYIAAGQSWQSGSTPTEVTGACFRLKKIGSPTGTMRASIYAHTGTYGASGIPTGSALASSVGFDVDTITTVYENYFFALSGWTPAATTDYFIVLEEEDWAGDGSNYVRAIRDNGAEATHGGNSTLDSGAGWGIIAGGGDDLEFKLYGTGSAAGVATNSNFSLSLALNI